MTKALYFHSRAALCRKFSHEVRYASLSPVFKNV